MFKNKKCGNNSFRNIVNCKCEFKKAVKLMVEECKKITDIKENKTITLTKKSRKL